MRDQNLLRPSNDQAKHSKNIFVDPTSWLPSNSKPPNPAQNHQGMNKEYSLKILEQMEPQRGENGQKGGGVAYIYIYMAHCNPLIEPRVSVPLAKNGGVCDPHW